MDTEGKPPSSDHEMEEDDTTANGDVAAPAAAAVDDHDEAPAFIHPDDADAEVVDVDLDHEPMEDDDDDGDEGDGKVMTDAADATPSTSVLDMADAVIEAHDGPVYAVAVAVVSVGDGDDGNGNDTTLRIASGGGDDRSFLTSYRVRGSGGNDSTKPKPSTTATSIELEAAAHRNTDTVSCLAFNNGDPEMLATGCYDGTIQLWEVGGLGEPRHVRQLDGPTDVEWLSFHPNGGTVLLAGSTDGTTWMYHVQSGKCLQVFVGHEDDVSAGSFTSDGKFAVTAGADGTLRVWAPRKGTCRHAFRNSGGGSGGGEGFAEGPLTCLAVGGGADGQLGIVGSVDGSAYVVHFGNKRVISRLQHHDNAVGGGGGDGIMREDDDDDEGEARSVEAVGFAPAGVNPNWCATGGVDGTLKVWDLTTGQCRQRCRHESSGGDGMLGGVTRLAWHPTRPLIYTSASDGVVRLWDARSGGLIGSWTGHTDVINDMQVKFGVGTNTSSTSTDVIVTGSDDGTVRVFEVDVDAFFAEAASAPAAAADVASAAMSGM